MSLVYGMLVSLPPLHHTLQQVGDGQTVREEKWIRIRYLGLNGYNRKLSILYDGDLGRFACKIMFSCCIHFKKMYCVSKLLLKCSLKQEIEFLISEEYKSLSNFTLSPRRLTLKLANAILSRILQLNHFATITKLYKSHAKNIFSFSLHLWRAVF